MGARSSVAVAHYGGSFDTFFSNLLRFCADSLTTCLSHDADRLCVPFGLSALSALLSLLSSFLLVHQRCTHLTEAPGETILFLYCLLGNLCSTTGAILSRQLHIQILMSVFASAVDAVNFMSCCLPVFLCWKSKAERRRRMMRKRRRQHLLAVCILLIIAGGFLKSRVSHYPADRPLIGRRLLQVFLRDNTEILGYVLGLISFVIACTSRFPALCGPHRRHMLTWAYTLSGLLCSGAGVLYTAALLLYGTEVLFLLRVMPWLLSAICCVTLDLLILVVHWCKRGARQHPVSICSDTECLLGDPDIPTEGNASVEKRTKQQVHSSAQTKIKNIQNVTEMGRYMDVSIRPARNICLKEVTLSNQEVADQFPDRTVRVIRVNSYYSSDTSYDSSPFSSDLEWDFEEANAQWRESTAKQQDGDEFPLMEWPKNPKPFSTCVMSGLPLKTLSGTEEGGSLSAVCL
ncbi:transmembrane protein 44 [Anabas testudineus]|uniref:transmembrane protein 44 n=1 Tax=Anabas testudineus TaxID=64144 RepID=UPI000E461CDA|nr:transmembrane protein 44 [Anabas testudineus]